MNRMKKHRIKEEKATTSSSHNRSNEEHDLAYFIHDRVELMHQVFSVLKSKELKSFAPECVRRLSIDDLQELCLEELLGISSKRLCAILDGAEPPSDTESSSQSEQLETISLDSISSDDEILSQGSKKKKHKHRHSKKKRRKKSKGSGDEPGETRASRAGLTVLELLELQARARAIRAQLHKEPTRAAEPAAEPPGSDNDEVLIKEEPAEVVEISSDDEKPDVSRLQQRIGTSTSQSNEADTNKKNDDSQAVTKRINDLIITVPQSKPTRKIKLKRQKPAETVTREVIPNKIVEKAVETVTVTVSNTVKSAVTANVSKITESAKKVSDTEAKNKAKKSKKKKKKVKEKEGSDQDEITIQLSDTEKMDLLEDLEAKNFDAVSSSDSDSSSTDSESDDDKNDDVKQVVEDKDEADNIENNKETTEVEAQIADNPKGEEQIKKNDEVRGYICNDNEGTVEINDLPVVTNKPVITDDVAIDKDKSSESKVDEHCEAKVDVIDETVEVPSAEKTEECVSNEKTVDKPESSSNLVSKSDGEISDRESSEVEASDVHPEVVCISDDEGKKKKKKKKEKKSKKEKKKSGFREEQDDNFYKQAETRPTNIIDTNATDVVETIDEDDDVYEYLEISDDSSCYEVEGISVLSKEPTAEEIEAFSARMDEIEIDREETVIPTEDLPTESNETDDLENVSWKDRYLGSKKVKRVLTTSNILNAIRKKNRELKKKLQEAKKAEQAEKETKAEEAKQDAPVEDGTIEQYETLQGSTKYVDPVKEVDTTEEPKELKEAEDVTKDKESEEVTKEMKKDAKMLLKMYKRLLKYNDINKQKDPNKKKKKKHKKNKEKEKDKEKA